MQFSRVVTPCGDIVGETTPYGSVFRGVRYAFANRFERPREVTVWDGEYSALEFGACCPQLRAYYDEATTKSTSFYYKEFRQDSKFSYGEDCLFLNMYVPSDAQGCPVVVFFHGGAFAHGSCDERPFDGAAYAKRNVIFVSVNYRLNIFGFYADGENCKGNLGLYDQLCAIRWLKHNIAAFGGDPDSIVLMGQSAGAMSVQTLVSSPLLDGQIKGAIMLSGGGIRRIILPERKPNVRFWKGIAKKCGADSFEKLKEMPAKQLFDAWRKSNAVLSLFATAPVVDGELVCANGVERYGVPCIIGSLKKDLFPPELRAMARKYAGKLKKQNKPCYIFEFVHSLPGDGKGTFHSADLWYAIGAMDRCWRPFGKEDYALSDEIVDRFAAFARTCTPNIDRGKPWEDFCKSKSVFVFE